MTSNRVKIVLVEDDLNLQNMYKLKLELEGYEVAVAANGLEGLKVTETIMPDLILLDLRMPVMSGDEMLAKLREQEWGSDIRVIVLTNISKNEAPQSLRFLSVDRYIVKAHSTPAQVVETIEEVLGVHGKPAGQHS
jgi:two-component system, OmpR family, response regulator AdeR